MQTPTGPYIVMVPMPEEVIHFYQGACWCNWQVVSGDHGPVMVHSKLIAQGWDWFIRLMPVRVM